MPLPSGRSNESACTALQQPVFVARLISVTGPGQRPRVRQAEVVCNIVARSMLPLESRVHPALTGPGGLVVCPTLHRVADGCPLLQALHLEWRFAKKQEQSKASGE